MGTLAQRSQYLDQGITDFLVESVRRRFLWRFSREEKWRRLNRVEARVDILTSGAQRLAPDRGSSAGHQKISVVVVFLNY